VSFEQVVDDGRVERFEKAASSGARADHSESAAIAVVSGTTDHGSAATVAGSAGSLASFAASLGLSAAPRTVVAGSLDRFAGYRALSLAPPAGC
jgi:hypothetical protein